MKRITLLLFLLSVSGIYAQCIQTNMNPYNAVASTNFGTEQVIVDCGNTYSYAQINNIIVGIDYVFTSQSMSQAHKYITVTNLSNEVIAHGLSPLTVSTISTDQIRVHLAENETCGTASGCTNLKIKALLSCPPPMNLQASGITTSDVKFTWNLGGAETAWEVLVLASGTAAPTDAVSGTAVSGTAEYLYTDLEPQHHYQFYVRANCGDEFSPWNGPLNFDSDCIAVNEFLENFNTGAVNTMPDCWSKIVRGVGVSANTKIAIMSGAGNGGTSCILMNNDTSSLDSDIILVLPPVDNLSAGTHRLKMATKAYAPVSLQVGTLTSKDNDAVFTVIDEISVGLNFTESAIDFTSYTGTDSYIGIRLNPTTTYSYAFMDDIRWELAPLCADVTNITVPTSTAESITLEWEYNPGIPQWEIVYGAPTDTDPTTLTPISPAFTTATGTITGLAENTSYKAWVRSACGGTNVNGAWIGPVSFTTACTGVAELNEDFESATVPALPSCWTAIRRGNSLSNFAEVKTTTNGAYAGTKAAMLNNSEVGNVSDIILVTPHLSNLSEGTHRLKFYARGGESIEVGTLNSNTQNSVFTPLEELELTDNYEEYIVDFTTYTGTDTNIGFRISSDVYATIVIDDVRWSVAPLCPDVSGISVSGITTDSANVTWEAGGVETQWDVAFGGESETDPNNVSMISPSPVSPTVQLTELSDNTTYKVWVRSDCGEPNGNGEWIGPVVFTTACLPVETLNENFDAVIVPAIPACWSSIIRGETVGADAKVETVNWIANTPPNSVSLNRGSSTGSFDVILVSPNLSSLPAGTHRLKFYARGPGGTPALEVGTLNGNSNTANFTAFMNVPISSTMTQYIVDFTTYEEEDTYIGIRHNTSSSYSTLFVDNIIWELAPLCPDAAGLAVVGKTATTADLAWTDNEVEGWQVVYGATTVTDPSTLTPSEVITSPTTQLTELMAMTTYNVWLRTVCTAPNGNGAWIGPITFTTACLAATEFEESFESAATPALPNCWSSILRGEYVMGNVTTVPYSAADGTKAISMNNSMSSGAYDIMIVSPELSNLGAGTHQLKFSVMTYSEGNVEIGTLNNKSADAVFTPLSSGSVPATSAYVEHVVDFSGYTGTDRYIGFRHSATASFTALLLDKISWEQSLSMDKIEGTGFRYYPNPVENVLHLSYDHVISEVTVSNMLGQIVLHTAVDNKEATIDVSALATGTYLVKIASGTIVKTIKVVKR